MTLHAQTDPKTQRQRLHSVSALPGFHDCGRTVERQCAQKAMAHHLARRADHLDRLRRDPQSLKPKLDCLDQLFSRSAGTTSTGQWARLDMSFVKDPMKRL